jgi:hypothetical protein
MQNPNRAFSFTFLGLLLTLGVVDSIRHGLALNADPRRWEYSPDPEEMPEAAGPWRENIRLERSTYGDLSTIGKLLPFRREMVETLSTDSYGFRNPGVRDGENFDAVILGDCFLMGSDGDLFHRHLEKVSGLRIYNYHHRRIWDFFSDSRFASQRPKFLIVERAERGFNSAHFQWLMDPRPSSKDTLSGIDRFKLKLRRWGNVASHSIFMESAQWALATLKYRLDRRLPGAIPKIVPALGMLFFHEEVFTHAQTLDERGLPAVLDSLTVLDRICRSRDIRLVVLMVPDKYSIYGRFASGRDAPADRGDILSPALGAGLRDRGILFADIFPLFKARGELTAPLLYERDDTRWTSLGKKLAAEEFCRQVPICVSSFPR